MPAALARAGDNAESIVQDIFQIYKEMKPLLASIKDQRTAEAARPKLLALGERGATLKEKAVALLKDPEQKKRLLELEKKYQQQGEAIIADLSREIKRISKLPGILNVLGDMPVLKQFDMDNARRERAKVDVQTLTRAVDTYFITNGEYPQTLKQLTEKQLDGGRPFLEAKALIDPWGRPYVYEPNTRDEQTGRPLIYSQGPRPGDPAGRIRNWPTPPKK
jgi:hypothetical protein